MTVKAPAQERGTAFHPALVDNFIESINR